MIIHNKNFYQSRNGKLSLNLIIFICKEARASIKSNSKILEVFPLR